MSAVRGRTNRFVNSGWFWCLSGVGVMALVAIICSLPASVSAQGTTPVNLANYVRIARYNLPEPTRTTPPDGTSLLAQEASSVTYDWDTDTLFVLGDGGTSVVQVSKTGVLIDSMTLAPGSSPQGTEFYDTEGITYIGSGKFVMTEERDRQLVEFTYAATVPPTLTQLHRADTKTVKLGTTIGNIGLEGVTWDPLSSATCNATSTGFIVVKEKDPRSIFQTCVDFNAGTATNGSPTTVESTDLFDPTLVPVIDFSDVFALSNLPGQIGNPDNDQLLIISQESGQVVQVDRSGNVLHTLTLVADPGDTISIPDMTNEGVTMDRNGFLYIVDEDGGGDANHPQLWVYAPSSATNAAPTAITLTGAVTSLPENTSTAANVRLADILVTDDGLGDNHLSVSGADAGSFEVVGTALFLKAGTTLNAATKPNYHINVDVDDAPVGGSPDASTAYTLTITAASSGTINLAITEVAPWSSGNTPPNTLNADWFEVTNFGTGSVSLVGWTMDDNSNSSDVSVPLHGVSSIAPGESVIFIETASLSDSDLAAKATAFINLWFGGTAPAGLQIGSYSGSGVGLSTGGDAVNLFDNGGTLRASVSFPAVAAGPPFYTFDNTAGLNGTQISNLSSVGFFGAHFAVNDTNEIGSPGTIGSGAAPIISITAPDANASETGSDPGTFRISRSGSVVSPLTVNYTIATGAGQATSDDYTPTLTGSAIIPAGSSFVDITITPVDDLLVEGPETVTLTLFDTGSYDVGSPASATVTIADNDVANLPPSAVVLSNTVPILAEATSTASAVRVADISITDDGVGVNTLSLSGTDASFFQITGSSLFLKAGTALSHATKPSYSVTVNVDDATVGGSPDASTSFTLTITASVAPGTIIISEVAPWGSSSTYAADWFELTNIGSVPADITGWQMDDNSNGTAKVALAGVTSIAPGQSVVFVETTGSTPATVIPAFETAWFGSNVPSGFTIGSYSGSGVGLSATADAVNVFDAAGNRITGVSFGVSTTNFSFDNAAGLGTTTLPLPTISILSVAGANGAFLAADGVETGSPGYHLSATISISNAPASGLFGGSFTPTFAYAGDGTTSVTSSTQSICTVSSGVVSFVGVGQCKLTAHATAGTNYPAVDGSEQSFSIGQAAQVITFTSSAPAGAKVGGATYTVTASGGASGNAVTFSIDAAAASVCTISGSTVSFTGVGTCVIDANQAGNTNYSAAAQAQQSFSVGPAATLQSITITPTNPSIAKGLTQQFTATGHYNDSTTRDLTSTASWTSSKTAVATINNAGLALGFSTGTSTIRAQLGAVSQTTTLTVTKPELQSITVTPVNPSIPSGTKQDFVAMGAYSDGTVKNVTSSVTWSSATTSVATINAGGRATGLAAGTSTIRAASGSISNSTTLTVTGPVLQSLSIKPNNPSIAKGLTKQFTVKGNYTDGSNQDLTASVMWSSLNATVATIGNAGLATGVGTGSSTIQATLGNISDSTTLTVTTPVLQSISVTPANPSIAKNARQQFTATGTYSDGSTSNLTSSVSWSSSKTSVATINSAGLATGIRAGTSSIRAGLTGQSGTATLTVGP